MFAIGAGCNRGTLTLPGVAAAMVVAEYEGTAAAARVGNAIANGAVVGMLGIP